ncbi:MAG: orotidine 5'-phosphate decarboxylase [Bdellovibrionales bacterium RBG_16_40_8]|nr:MAG: orotidine 5'-phosphate decarboxylase [Bdellovibrionales bacterium RBG_16_40_8]
MGKVADVVTTKLTSPIFVALDLDSDIEALKLAKDLRPYVGGFKIGPRLTYKYGSLFVKKLADIGTVFVDNKYHDIPSTVLAALRCTFESGASFVTLHASNGYSAMKEFAKLEIELSRERPFQILSVTVMTSFDESSLPSNWRPQTVRSHVEALAQETIVAGLSGIVCSPDEVSTLRSKFPEAFLVTPGIRLPGDHKGDQLRVMGPSEAIQAGASALVIGRPIVAAADPVLAAKKIYDLIG